VIATWGRPSARGVLVASALLGCAHGQAPQRQKLDIQQPTIVTAGPPALVPLLQMDDATLFDAGTRAFQSGDFDKAAQSFDRLWQGFPDSQELLPALWNAALSQERLARYAESLLRLEKYLGYKDEPEAQFHAAYAEYQLHRLEAAAARLDSLQRRPALKPLLKAQALLQEGVCKIEGGKRSEGELLVRAALEAYGKLDEPVDPALPAQGEFWLGEGSRGSFKETAIDPLAMGEEKLQAALEAKSRFLLEAQEHYLKAIHLGDGEWATAAGFRIGELYESFHDELVQAPAPGGLTPEQRVLYQSELHKKVRNLVTKAIRIYEQTLTQAQESGANNAYRQKTQDALDRLRRLLLENS
jgi:tetratricopeptide (TPR) repeat protein